MKNVLLGVAVVLCLFMAGRGEAAYLCTGTVFNDVNDSLMSPAFCGFIEEFALRGVTSGCQADDPGTPGNEAMYCPDDSVTRAQMAVFMTSVMDMSGDITSVSPGTGLTGGGAAGDVTLNVNTSYIQRRVNGTCASGSSIRVINANGTVTCETNDTGVGTNTLNYVPKWNGSALVKGSIYDNGYIGIGTTSPSNPLHVVGNTLVEDPGSDAYASLGYIGYGVYAYGTQIAIYGRGAPGSDAAFVATQMNPSGFAIESFGGKIISRVMSA